jgi:hypothetical protein
VAASGAHLGGPYLGVVGCDNLASAEGASRSPEPNTPWRVPSRLPCSGTHAGILRHPPTTWGTTAHGLPARLLLSHAPRWTDHLVVDGLSAVHYRAVGCLLKESVERLALSLVERAEHLVLDR